ncbi:MAG: PQQ-binding-like beta-propeller repeat protein [Rubripirellula sp.]
MPRFIVLSLALVSTLLVTASHAQTIPPHVAKQLGLTQAWMRHVNVPTGVQSISDQQLFVHESEPNEYVEIVKAAAEGEEGEGEVLTRILTTRLGSSGQAIGLQEAQRLASNEIRRLKRRSITASMNVRKVPRVRLYTIANDGMLESRDAETGEPIWTVKVGDQRLPYSALGVGEKNITVINGANVILVEASTGEVIQEVQSMSVPSYGAVISGKYAMVPTMNSSVQGYHLDDLKQRPFLEMVAGSPLALPTKAPGTTRIAWGTDRGYVYVMELQGRPSVLFRLNTDGTVHGRIAAASGDRFYFGSESGQVYGLRATRTGRVMWSMPFGEPFYHEPIVMEDQLLIRSTFGNLYSLALDSGIMQWEEATSNVADLIGSFGDYIYVTNLSGSFGVLDKKTGRQIQSYSSVRPASYLVNKLTDRLYLVDEAGNVQCLRKDGATLPTFNTQPDIQEQVEEPVAADPKDDTPFGADPGMSDPFGGGSDADPFGGSSDADPFGGSDEESMDDPFGGDNPFG